MAMDSLGIEDSHALNVDDLEERLAEAEAVGWPDELEAAYTNLQRVKPDRVVNANNLGDMRFVGADSKLADVVRTLADLRREEWRLIGPGLTGNIVANTTALLNTLQLMAELRSSQADAQVQRDNLDTQFDSHYRFFMDQVRPICTTARVEEIIRDRKDLLAGDVTHERVEQLEATFRKLEAEAEEFKNLSTLVTAQRQLVGKEGVSNLSHHFTELARTSREAFEKWAICLGVSVVLGGIASVAFVYLSRPEDTADTAEIVTHVFLDVLVVGLVVFLIRFFAVQTRAYRHVEFTARNKANALSTFNLIVAGQEDDVVRAQVASALAQAVFKSDDGIFSDASSDSVTIVERVIGAAATKAPTGP
jgi:hypothetical protein